MTQHPTVRGRGEGRGPRRSVAVIVGTAAKWAIVTEGRWPWAIVDEAYQMRSDVLLRIAARFERALFVGDPGQLDPFSTVETERWIGLTWDPMQSAVAVLLRHNPELPVHRLPVSWRLPASAAPVVAEAFYPFTAFEAGTTADERSLSFRHRGYRRRARWTGCCASWRRRPGGRCTSCRPGTRCVPTRRRLRRARRWRVRLLERGAVARLANARRAARR